MMSRKKSSSPSGESGESKEASSASRTRKTLLIKKKGSPSRAVSRSGSKTSTNSVANQDGPPSDSPDLPDRIASRAHELYSHRGGHHGLDWEDWFEAERQVLEEGC